MGFRAATSNILSTTSDTKSVGTIPAGVQAGDRVYAFIGSGATAADPLTVPAGWTQVGVTYHPTSNLFSALLYRDIASPAEAGGTVNFVWSGAASRTWAILQAYSDVDLTRAPVSNVTSSSASSAGPFTAPIVIVPSQDWLITFACGRESPGTDTAKTWTITPAANAERADVFSNQTGVGQKITAAGWDSNGVVTAGSGGSGGSVDLGPQARPTNTYNAIATSGAPFLIGATVKKDELTYWKPKLAALDWMRVFPDSDGLPPDWTDSRILFCRDFGAQPFLSSKVDGNTADLTALATYLKAMPSWIKDHPNPNFKVWITDRHEPEGDVTPAAYKTNIGAFFDMIEDLPSNILARLEYGHVLTRQWTENTAGRVYSTHDTGRGTFFGVDMYANSWGSPSDTVATSFPNATTFLSRFKAYQFNSSDHRKRVMPELGAIGIPADTTGATRAAWIQAVHDQILTWTYAAQGWDFAGWCWWCAEGKSGTSLKGAGAKRWFTLDRRHSDSTTTETGSYVILPSVAAPGGGSGSGSSVVARTVSVSVPVNATHTWSVTVPQSAPVVVDPATVNAWTYLGLPQGAGVSGGGGGQVFTVDGTTLIADTTYPGATVDGNALVVDTAVVSASVDGNDLVITV